MRRYETIFIMDHELSDDLRDAVIERVTDLISQHGGLLVDIDHWGTRKLAYEIKKKVRGYYVCATYCGNGDLVDEIERFFRIDDRVIKYMTIVLDKDADIEQVKAEIAQAEESEKAAALEAAQKEKDAAAPKDSETAEATEKTEVAEATEAAETEKVAELTETPAESTDEKEAS